MKTSLTDPRYAIEKISDSIYSGEYKSPNTWGSQVRLQLREELEQIKNQSANDSMVECLDDCIYVIDRIPDLNTKDAQVFLFFLKENLQLLDELSKEVFNKK